MNPTGARPIVLVPGACLGGWCWRAVAAQLRASGHDVYPLTLTGLGERVHLARPDVDLATHISDVVNVLDYEDLREAVLVGHSYAGIVITGVADRFAERAGHASPPVTGRFGAPRPLADLLHQIAGATTR